MDLENYLRPQLLYKTIILAAGRGSRLWPSTAVTNKQLLPIFDKPMIYYTLSLAMLAGSREIEIIVNPHEIEQFKLLLRDGSQFGISIKMLIQVKPNGIADAFNISQQSKEPTLLLLGDNLLYGVGLGESLSTQFSGDGALMFTYPVSNPSDYGIANIVDGKIISIEEKPENPNTNLAIPGIYFFDQQVFNFVKEIKPSKRGELEITDILKKYLEIGKLNFKNLERGTAWLDTGSAKTMQSASEFIKVIEERQGFKIGCPEEVAFRMGFISKNDFKNLIDSYPSGEYKTYLNNLVYYL